LYNFIEGKLDLPVSFYLFYPHGDRKISNLRPLKAYKTEQMLVRPNVIIHDQEPLNFEHYSDQQAEMQEFKDIVDAKFKENSGIEKFVFLSNLNLNLAVQYVQGASVFDHTVLLHSELNSQDMIKYQAHGFETAYWWSHAMIARDWYRYAQYDPDLNPGDKTHNFLVYSRGFTNTREYRLKFIEFLYDHGLLDNSKITLLDREQQQYVKNYTAKDPRFQIRDSNILDFARSCTVGADASAMYDARDFNSTYLSVVLETQFSDSKIHLTEKILRPIACGHPFILAAAPGALRLLRRYGFETFESLIDESYDLEPDPVIRLYKISEAMKKLNQMDSDQWQAWSQAANKIAHRNKIWFFSDDFQSLVLDEIFTNLRAAIQKAAVTKGENWLRNRKLIRQHQPNGYKNYLYRNNERIKAFALRKLRS